MLRTLASSTSTQEHGLRKLWGQIQSDRWTSPKHLECVRPLIIPTIGSTGQLRVYSVRFAPSCLCDIEPIICWRLCRWASCSPTVYIECKRHMGVGEPWNAMVLTVTRRSLSLGRIVLEPSSVRPAENSCIPVALCHMADRPSSPARGTAPRASRRSC
jgi:hypothetical protein